MGSFSLIHWIILGVVILLLFGGNRFSAMMGDIAKGLKSFKQGMSEDDSPPQQPRHISQERPIDITPQRTGEAAPPPPQTPPPSRDETPRG